MQYAQIIPNRKIDFSLPYLTYKIPPEILSKIKIGSLVQIPLGNAKTEGVVFKITKIRKKAIEEKLKPISSVIEEEPILDELHFKLAHWLSEYYLAPLSLCLFEMFPLPPKRPTKRTPLILKTKPPLANDLSIIKKICQKALNKNKKVLILAPTIEESLGIHSALKKIYPRVGLYYGQLPPTLRYQTFKEVKANKYKVIVGTRSALFLPLYPLGAIVLTSEESDAYKNERSPRYQTKTVAQKIAKLTSCKLFLISQSPSIESYFKAKKKAFFLIKTRQKAQTRPKTFIINLGKEGPKNKSSLSEELKSLIKKFDFLNKKILLFVARRGAASYIFCKTCGFVLKCPKCEWPLVYHLVSNRLFCHHCRFKTDVPDFCPNCRGLTLKFSGIGIQKVENDLKKLLIKPEILRIEEDTIMPSKIPNIVIGTQKLLSFIKDEFDLVAIVSIDPLLNLPDLNASEKIFGLISKLKPLAKSVFVIQTYHPDNFIIKRALLGDFLGFYQREIAERKRFSFPPFSTLIRLINQGKKEEKVKKETEIFASKLRSIVRSNNKIEITGPSPCFYPKIRGKYRWQILIKSKKEGQAFVSFKNILKTLPEDWIIDVEPITLL